MTGPSQRPRTLLARLTRAGLHRRLPPLPLGARLVFSHLAVVAIALLAMYIAADVFVVDDPPAESGPAAEPGLAAASTELLWGALGVGLAAALVPAWAFSRLLLRPLRDVRRATHRLADGHYDEILGVPREPGLAALVEDVNRLAAALADIERRRARLVSEIAHEMRTPLAIIGGQLEGIADGIFTPDAATLAALTDDLSRLRRLADDLSSLSRIEEGAFTLHRAPTDLSALAQAACERLRPQFDDRQILLTLNAGPGATAAVDAGRITQILINLLGNALPACDPGGHVTVTVRADRGPAPGIELRVTDDGIGIAGHDLARIFSRFERVEHPGRSAPAGGSGIGLTIARGIARAHGGDITAASPGLGRGSTFTVRLPESKAAYPRTKS
ncbi:HAMP domain-containing sensor histidine kinase [Streptomyces shenzhenensis]|uniref:sensor histidine kinase n=1 Tax=Streptomyces shenzhenensis TaxID=943815 RepID=UPI0033DAC1B7